MGVCNVLGGRETMKKFRVAAVALLVTALALTGCSSKKKETEAVKETQAPAVEAASEAVSEAAAAVDEAITEAAAAVETAQTEAAEAVEAAQTEAAEAVSEAAEAVETLLTEAEEAASEAAEAVETAITEAEEAASEAVEEVMTEVEEVAETEAAVAETEAAVVETEAAVEETEAPVVETEAAVEETEAAVEETEAAVEETEAAVEETEAAVEETEAAIEETEAAVAETEAEVAAETEAEEASDVMSYEDFAAAEVDDPVVIETFVQAKQALWEGNTNLGCDTATLYTQDEEGGYFLYDIPVSAEVYEKLEEGTKIRVSGYKSEWAGEVEVVADDDLTEVEIVEGEEFVAGPVDITEMLGDEEMIKQFMNQKVSFTEMTVEAVTGGNETEAEDGAAEDAAFLYGWDGSGSEGDDLYFSASKDGKVYTFVVESYLCGPDTDVYKAVKELKAGDTIDMEGFLYWYEGMQPHITSVTVK